MSSKIQKVAFKPVGLLLGIAERSSVRTQFPRRLPSLDALTDDLV